MNLLILIDPAPNYHKFFVNLGKAFNKLGHKTFYAIDSPLSGWRNPDSIPEGESRVFSEYFAKHMNHCGNVDFPWRAFFPDFDRYENFGVNYGKKHEWYINLGSALDAFFESCITDWKIDAVIYEGVTNSYAYFANRAAERHGVKYIGIQASRLPGRYELHGNKEDILRHNVRHHYEALSRGVAVDEKTRKLVSEYLSNFKSSAPDYMKSNGLLLQNPLQKYAKSSHNITFIRLGLYQILKRSKKDQCYRIGAPLTYSFKNVIRNTLRWLKSIYVKKFFRLPDFTESYYLYPLHFHPEASTSVNSRWYVDEYPVIKNLAFSLPSGSWLYVKDHPSAIGYPSIDFYRQISFLPNVKLISPQEDTKSLIASSIGVITQTSTVGYEALVLEKPTWVLGDVFYDFHPLCEKIGWNQDLEKSLSSPSLEQPAMDRIEKFVTAYFLSTKRGMLPIGGETQETVSYLELAREIAFNITERS